jgi:hypothetical protein
MSVHAKKPEKIYTLSWKTHSTQVHKKNTGYYQHNCFLVFASLFFLITDNNVSNRSSGSSSLL